jgi:hypothetical protein
MMFGREKVDKFISITRLLVRGHSQLQSLHGAHIVQVERYPCWLI